MNRFELYLYVCSYPKFECRADEDSYFTGIEFAKQLYFTTFGIITVNKSYLFFGYSFFDKSGFKFLVNAEVFTFRGGIIAKNNASPKSATIFGEAFFFALFLVYCTSVSRT